MNNIFQEFKKIYRVATKEFNIKLIVSIVLRGILLILPIFFSNIIDYATNQNYDKAHLYTAITLGIVILYRITECISQKTFYNLFDRLYQYYNSLGIDKTNDNSIFSLSRFNLGQYTNMLTTDVEIISAFFANGVLRFVQLLEFVFIYAYFWSINPFVFLTAIVISLVVILLIPPASKSVEKYNSIKKLEQDKLVTSTHEYFKNIKDIKCFNLFDKISPRTKGQTSKFLSANAKYNVRYYYNNQIFLLVFEAFRMLTVGYGVYLVSKNALAIGALLIIYNYYQKIIDNFGTLLTISVEYTNLKVSLERFNHLVEFVSHKKTITPTTQYMQDGRIEFRNILYGYKNDPTLKNVSLEILPNTLTVITGKANTGKTGIFDLLLKLNRQHQGEILIDDINIADIPDSEYFSNISLLRKNPLLFNMSIKDNLLLVESEENRIINLCVELGIHDEILKLKDGYNTVLDENDGISTSLKQLLAIARTILKGSKIMLFDDALIGLDDSQQDKILNLLLSLKNTQHTIVMISHEKNVLKDADKIIIMDNKEVIATGTFEELKSRL